MNSALAMSVYLIRKSVVPKPDSAVLANTESEMNVAPAVIVVCSVRREIILESKRIWRRWLFPLGIEK